MMTYYKPYIIAYRNFMGFFCSNDFMILGSGSAASVVKSKSFFFHREFNEFHSHRTIVFLEWFEGFFLMQTDLTQNEKKLMNSLDSALVPQNLF